MSLSIEERYDEVRQLIAVGKEKGYLLYDEVNEALPSEITSSEELDDLFNAFGTAGIEVVDSDKAYRGDKDFDRDGSEEGPELDLTPGALDKTNDPVRMYLSEMGTVPLLSLIHISEPTRLLSISYAVFCLKKKKKEIQSSVGC